MACILRVSGTNLALDECLGMLTTPPDRIWRRDTPRSAGPSARDHTDSGFTLVASDDDEILLEEVRAFLDQRREELQTLTARADVDVAVLDFALFFEAGENLPHMEHFHSDFVNLCAELRLAIEVSVYPVQDGRH
jgi:Domain of unknown function (DUF4279)